MSLGRAFWAAWWLWLGLCCVLVPARATAAGGGGDSAAASANGRVVVGDAIIVALAASESASAAERARQANRALSGLIKKDSDLRVAVTREADAVLIAVDGEPVLRLIQADAVGSVSLDAFAEQVADDLEVGLLAERRRARIANDVLSLSLVVLFGLVAFFAMRFVSNWVSRARTWTEQRSEPVTFRIRDVEIIGPEMIESAAVVALSLLRWFGQAAIAYAWLVGSLSLFPATRAYTEKLTGVFITPLSQLTTRIAALLPVLVLVGIAALAVFVLVRFVGLFFASVAKRETSLSWVAPDLAIAVSVVLRAAMVVAALLFIGPLVTGDAYGTFSQLGIVFLGALALSSTPLLASALVGMLVVFRRQLRVGDFVMIGATIGRVSRLTLLEVRVESLDGVHTRVPALSLLRTAVVHLGREGLVQAEVLLGAEAEQQECERTLMESATQIGTCVGCTLISLDPTGQRYRVSVRYASEAQARLLIPTLVSAARRAGFPLISAHTLERST